MEINIIGVARTPFQQKSDIPRQAQLIKHTPCRIELEPRSGFEHALEGLASWSHLWVLSWMDRAEHFRPKVLPPRSPKRLGVFATRSPHRPNPIGLSAVQLYGVEGLVLSISGVDLIDQTPIIDIKPYLPYADSIPHANSGWLEPAISPIHEPGIGGSSNEQRAAPNASSAASSIGADWPVLWSEYASAQLDFLERFGVNLRERLSTLLATGPHPHPYRRIRALDGAFQIAAGSWRARFVHSDIPGIDSAPPLGIPEPAPSRWVYITALGTGYRAPQLYAMRGAEQTAELELHRAFVERFGYPGDIAQARNANRR